MRDKKLSMLIEGAIMIAVAEVLSMLPTGLGRIIFLSGLFLLFYLLFVTEQLKDF